MRREDIRISKYLRDILTKMFAQCLERSIYNRIFVRSNRINRDVIKRQLRRSTSSYDPFLVTHDVIPFT